MRDEFLASKPIYMQIVERITKQIVRHELAPGDKLPSVREMAVQTGVNPNTIQRTYSELERMEIVETRRGQGTFVSENNEVLLSLKINMQKEVIQTFIQNMNDLGFSEEEIMDGVNKFLADKKGEK